MLSAFVEAMAARGKYCRWTREQWTPCRVARQALWGKCRKGFGTIYMAEILVGERWEGKERGKGPVRVCGESCGGGGRALGSGSTVSYR